MTTSVGMFLQWLSIVGIGIFVWRRSGSIEANRQAQAEWEARTREVSQVLVVHEVKQALWDEHQRTGASQVSVDFDSPVIEEMTNRIVKQMKEFYRDQQHLSDRGTDPS